MATTLAPSETPPTTPRPGAPGTGAAVAVPPAARRWAGLRILAFVLVAALSLAGALLARNSSRRSQQRKVDAEAQAVSTAKPRVTVAVAKAAAQDTGLTLPGSALPLLDAALYARTTGYLKRRLVDIGDRV